MSASSGGLTQFERRVVVGSVLILMLFSAFFWNPAASEWLFGSWGGEGDAVATLVQPRNDVRRKGARRFNWLRAPAESTLSVGDALFTGEKSGVTLALKDGRTIEIEEQTLIRFVTGADGRLRLLLNGEEVEIPVAGSAIRVGALRPPEPARRPAALASLTYPPVLFPADAVAQVWHLEDLYEVGPVLRRRAEPAAVLSARASLRWRDHAPGASEIQISRDGTFADGSIEGRVEGDAFEADRLFVGRNAWRVRKIGGPWSETESFNLDVSFLPQGPRLNAVSPFVVSFGESVAVPLSWTLPPGQTSALVEITAGETFKAEETRVHWVAQAGFAASLPPGRYRVRVAGLDERHALSVFSPPQTIDVGEPPLLAGPRVPTRELVYELTGDARARLRWTSPPGARARFVSVADAQGRALGEYAVNADHFDLPLTLDGNYTYQVTAQDQWGRRGKPSLAKPFTLRHPAPLLAQQDPPRAPAQVSPSLAARLSPVPAPLPPNGRFAETNLQIEGASFGMFSSEQVFADEELPLAATLGVRWTRWWNNLGLEWSYKGKAFNYNTAAATVSPSSMEARAEVRTHGTVEWFDFLREYQLSGILGAEMYRNANTGLYASSYDLVKLGSRLDFSLGRRWATGGELLYGMGTDNSQKYEVSGHLNYFLNKEWALGFGYRAHAFEAGSERSTPLGLLPYREAYGEGFTVMRYIY